MGHGTPDKCALNGQIHPDTQADKPSALSITASCLSGELCNHAGGAPQVSALKGRAVRRDSGPR